MIRIPWNFVSCHAAAALDWLWPPLCPRCGARAGIPREQFCVSCWGALRSLRPSERRWRLQDDPDGTPAIAAFAVDGLFLDLLTTSKYRRVRPVGRRLAELAAERVWPLLPEGVLVPVPLTVSKRRERGFNQPEDLARVLARRTGREVCTDLLVRRRGGRALAGRRKEDRAAAVQGAFAATRRATPVGMAPVVVVDDVVTTGSTARSCFGALREGGWPASGVVAIGRAFQSRSDVPPRSVPALLERL